MKDLIEKLILRQDLTESEMRQAFEAIMSGSVSESMISAFLVGLRAKGEKPAEIAAAAHIMRAKARPVTVDYDVIDTCGTGGDYASTFNISTAVAILLAGAGLKVAKHGNRSASSSSGSADCLEALGVPIMLEPQAVTADIDAKGFAFMFAPAYHPSMKYAMPVRKTLGIKTIFNILGPLANPARAHFQVMGVYADELIEPIIETLAIMGLKGAMVVHSGLDEVSVEKPTRYARLKDGRIESGYIKPADAGIRISSVAALKVSSAAESAALVEKIFSGEETGAPLDAVLLNAGAAFMAAGRAADIREGVELARGTVARGDAMAALERLRV